MRIAFVADIHGNLPALEAVLQDLKQQSPDAVYLVGDQINRCPWNNEVLDLLNDQQWPAIAGNHELIVGIIRTPNNRLPFTNAKRYAVLWWTQANLRAEHLHAIRRLPEQMVLTFDNAPPILMVHGVPGQADIGFYPGLNDDALSGYLDGVTQPVVVCAHTHRPMDRQVGDRHLFNGGAVGLPYNGDPRAHYLLLDLVQSRSSGSSPNRWRPTFRRLDYDRDRIEPAFAESGLLAAAGPLAELDLYTLETGHPWSSDFGIWMRGRPKSMQKDLRLAIDTYLEAHGPGNWAFDEPA